MSLVPVVAICEAHLFLGEIMAPVQILGGAIILATMVVIKRGE
jgi:drug/metabolite transporter (DMT)-like permease